MWEIIDGYIRFTDLMELLTESCKKKKWKLRDAHFSATDIRRIVQQKFREDQKNGGEEPEGKEMPTVRIRTEQRLCRVYDREGQITELCGDSKGAEIALRELEVMTLRDTELFLRAIDDIGIYGEALYQLWDMCCARDARRMADTIRLYMDGLLDGEELYNRIIKKKVINPEWIRELRKREEEEKQEEESWSK